MPMVKTYVETTGGRVYTEAKCLNFIWDLWQSSISGLRKSFYFIFVYNPPGVPHAGGCLGHEPGAPK